MTMTYIIIMSEWLYVAKKKKIIIIIIIIIIIRQTFRIILYA
jgi:hypothetical protein